jgi:hypothetical protein
LGCADPASMRRSNGRPSRRQSNLGSALWPGQRAPSLDGSKRVSVIGPDHSHGDAERLDSYALKLSVNPYRPREIRSLLRGGRQRSKSRKGLFFSRSRLLLQSGPLSTDAAKCTNKYGEVHARCFTSCNHKFLPKKFHLCPSCIVAVSMRSSILDANDLGINLHSKLVRHCRYRFQALMHQLWMTFNNSGRWSTGYAYLSRHHRFDSALRLKSFWLQS